MAALRLLNRARVTTQADLAIPNRQPRGAVRIEDGITAHFVYLMGAHKRLRDLSGDGAILTNYGGSIEGPESSYITQDSGVQGFYTGNIESLAGKPVTIVFFGEKGRLSATTNPYRVLFGVSDSNLVDGSSTWRITLGNDFGGLGTKESVRYEGPDSTGLYINGHKQASATLSDTEYTTGARLNIVTTVSALPAGGSANIWVGSNGTAPANKRGMKGHVELVAVIEGELSEAKCLALSAGDYSVLFKAANDSPFLAPVAGSAVLAAGTAISVATAGGSLTTEIPLSATAASVTTAAGELVTSVRLAGDAIAQAAAAAGLTTQIDLGGNAGAGASGDGAIVTAITLAGPAQVASQGSGGLTIQIRLDGAALARSTAVAALASAAAPLAGSAYGKADAAAQLITDVPVTGAALSTSGASGSLAGDLRLAGNAGSGASAQGGLSTAIPLSGAAASVVSAIGSLDMSITLAGNAIAQALAGGDLTAQIRLSGSAVAQAAGSGGLAGGQHRRPPAPRMLTVWPEARHKVVGAERRRLIA